MNMKQIWGLTGGFFAVYILITLTNRPHVRQHGQTDNADMSRGQANGQEARNQNGSGRGAADAGDAITLAPGFQRGVVYDCPGISTLSDAGSDGAIANISGVGANWVAIDVPLSQQDGTSEEVGTDAARTPMSSAVGHAIDAAHRHQLKVMLRPLVVARDGTPREDFAPADAKRWLASYQTAIAPFMDMATSHQAELVCIGSGYARLEAKAPWADLAKDLRRNYTGSLTYGASRTSYQAVPFWSSLDFAGIEGFFPLTTAEHPSADDLAAGWKAVASEVKQWAAGGASGKPVLFTAVGVPALANGAANPDRPDAAASPDPALEKKACRAFYQTMAGETWLNGAFWYDWEYRPDSSPSSAFAVQDQPTQAVLQAAYGGSR